MEIAAPSSNRHMLDGGLVVRVGGVGPFEIIQAADACRDVRPQTMHSAERELRTFPRHAVVDRHELKQLEHAARRHRIPATVYLPRAIYGVDVVRIVDDATRVLRLAAVDVTTGSTDFISRPLCAVKPPADTYDLAWWGTSRTCRRDDRSGQ